VVIRPADVADSRRLAQLRWEFRAGKDAPIEKEDAFVERCAAWMSAALAAGAWRAWVAEKNDATVGQIWMHVVAKVPNPVGERDRHAYISNLYVTPSARGGVGSRLLEAALAHASANRVDRIVLWPTSRSRSMYTRYGFTRNGEVFELICG
jgi:ribosomal protein S18 acetylase RimI-like enzyme